MAAKNNIIRHATTYNPNHSKTGQSVFEMPPFENQSKTPVSNVSSFLRVVALFITNEMLFTVTI